MHQYGVTSLGARSHSGVFDCKWGLHMKNLGSKGARFGSVRASRVRKTEYCISRENWKKRPSFKSLLQQKSMAQPLPLLRILSAQPLKKLGCASRRECAGMMGSYIQPGFAANQVGMPTYLERGMERNHGSEHQKLGLFDILSSLHNMVSSNLALDHDGIVYANTQSKLQ